jgi:hypothetical protein
LTTARPLLTSPATVSQSDGERFSPHPERTGI